ncbi:MAG TPA: NeuD/PglB/VioB family sugar acetyltransferase [Bryobacteraceae bacterium]|jgi:sugar O-acyltransferase (sialic acid O-acetyltransferase NeuD family)|nr:NeuD/PglB/VioB family sugar acetyltransferase [Bryobacteraceae bacterium]
MSNRPGLALLGFGGHARSVADVALAAGYERLTFVEETAREGESFLGFPVQREIPFEASKWVYLPCAGDNLRRQAQFHRLMVAALPLATVISSVATIGHGATLGPGCFVGHHAHVGPMASIGAACIINTGAIIEHDCVAGDCCHVSIGARLAGKSRLGNCVFLGAGAVVVDGMQLASNIIIGAGGVVVKSLDVSGVYAGVPVRRIADFRS